MLCRDQMSEQQSMILFFKWQSKYRWNHKFTSLLREKTHIFLSLSGAKIEQTYLPSGQL